MNLAGHVDGIRDGEVYGWALDTDDPGRPLTVAVYLNGEAVTTHLAGYHRPDVAKRLGCPASHGFYIDLGRFCARKKTALVEVRAENGQLLEGNPLLISLPARPQGPAHTALFMHIPKTAGTAIREAAETNYKQSEIGYLYPTVPGLPVRDLQEVPLEQRRGLRFISGHFQYGIHVHVPNPSSYWSVVREPVGRVWSQYSYLFDQGNPIASHRQGRASITELLEGKATVVLDNLMVRCFAGVWEEDYRPGTIDRDVYQLAIRNAESFRFVGMQHQLADFYERLKTELEWTGDLGTEPVNRGLYFGASSQPTEFEEAAIRRFNSWDCKLYDYFCGRQ